MNQQAVKDVLRRKRACSAYRLMVDYRNYVRQKKLARNQKIVFGYKDVKLGFTERQILFLKLISSGLSNSRIAQQLNIKEPTVKLAIYRLMRYLENILYEKVDRYRLVIIAQQLRLENRGW